MNVCSSPPSDTVIPNIPPVSGRARASPGRRLPPAPGDRRFLPRFLLRMRPQPGLSPVLSAEDLKGSAVRKAEGTSDTAFRLVCGKRPEPVGVEVPDHIPHRVLAGRPPWRSRPRPCPALTAAPSAPDARSRSTRGPRRTILTSRRPSSSSISRIRSRSLTAPVSADKAPERKGERNLLRH